MRSMNPEDSLNIISRMMSDTRRGVLQYSYTPFLIWGGSTIVVSALVYIVEKYSGNYLGYYLWYILPVLGLSISRIFKPRQKSIRTGISTSLRSIWWMLTILMVGFSVSSFMLPFNILFIILLLLSIGSFVTGAVIAYPFLQYSSVAGFIVSILLLLISGINQIPVFAAAIAVMMIVPGLKMKQDLDKSL